MRYVLQNIQKMRSERGVSETYHYLGDDGSTIIFAAGPNSFEWNILSGSTSKAPYTTIIEAFVTAAMDREVGVPFEDAICELEIKAIQ